MLDANFKPDRLASSEELLQILEECHQNGFLIVLRLITDKRLWFFVDSLESRGGTASRDGISEKVTTKIDPERG
jgi:hypothetical protein